MTVERAGISESSETLVLHVIIVPLEKVRKQQLELDMERQTGSK